MLIQNPLSPHFISNFLFNYLGSAVLSLAGRWRCAARDGGDPIFFVCDFPAIQMSWRGGGGGGWPAEGGALWR